jgi:hypothetical protein
MTRTIRRLAAALAVAGLVTAAPGAALAGELSKTTVESEAASPMVDALLMRPLGLLGLGASAVLWVPAQTVTMAVRWNDREDWRKPYDALLRKPYEFVFVDPLGTH